MVKNDRIAAIGGILSVVGMVSLVISVLMFTTFLGLFSLNTTDSDDFRKKADGSMEATLDTAGSGYLELRCSSVRVNTVRFHITVTGPDGEMVIDENVSSPFSETLRMNRAGKYLISITMINGNFDDMEVSGIIVDIWMLIFPAVWSIFSLAALVLILSGTIVGIFAMYKMVKRKKNGRSSKIRANRGGMS